MYWDRFDICEAYYLYAMLYHSGQFSPEYALFSVFARIQFRPPSSLSSEKDLTENGREIFRALVSGETTIRDRGI